MLYGTESEVIERDGSVEEIEVKYYKGDIISRTSRFTETVVVKGDSAVIAELLKLLDQHKAGTVWDLGIKCVTDKKNQIVRIEKTWNVRHLL